ncbi:MAG: hypothetical protein Q8L68_00525 [Methylococcales bacterium]|nr:hypothetical protein [Methylococcales bacterium]
MTNQSAINLFIILAIMSAMLFFHQTATLTRLVHQPAFEVAQIQSPVINEQQIKSSENSFWKSAREYRDAVSFKDKSDITRRIINFISSPLSWVFQGLDIVVDSFTNIEDEADGVIASASAALDQKQSAIQRVIQEMANMEQEYNKVLQSAKEQVDAVQQQQIRLATSLRNIALLLFLFSVSSAFFARPPRLDAQAEWLPAERPAALKQALGFSVAGGLMSALASLDGMLFFQLIAPSLLIGYFITRRRISTHPSGRAIVLGSLGFGLLVAIVILGLHARFGMPTEFAVSGFLLGLFIALAIECVSLPLTTWQFFLVALMLSMARLIAALSAANGGAELTVLEGIIGIVTVLWVIQIHASWVRIIRFDVLLVWFSVYSAVAFGLGNYFQAGFSQLLGSYITTALAGGGLLSYHLSKARIEKELLPRLSNRKATALSVHKK